MIEQPRLVVGPIGKQPLVARAIGAGNFVANQMAGARLGAKNR